MADFDKFPEAFKAFGINFTEEGGWRGRGHGDIKDPRFIVIHHTAGGGSDQGDIRVVTNGRSDLPGPLSQLVFKRNGEPHIIAQGVSWHAYGTINFRGVAARSGNYYSLGIEGVSNGYNDWTEAQRREYPRIVAALLKYMGLPADAWIFHRDYQPGEKIDPAGFDRDWFARQVRAYYDGNGSIGPVETAIQAKRRENPWLGDKTSAGEEQPTADGVGRWCAYQNGHIYWHPNLGAKVVSSEIFAKYSTVEWEIGFLGYPLADTIPISGGKAQGFQGGSIYYNAATNEAFILNGVIGSRWAELKWETGPLGFPQTDEIPLPDKLGVLQRFEKGHIYYSPETGAKEIYYGHIWEEFVRLDYEKGPLGYPVGIAVESQDRRGVIQSFQKGAVYALNGRTKEDGNGLWGDIFEMYGRLGYETGRLGFPITDVYRVNESTDRVDFEAGSIERNFNNGDMYLVLSGKRVNVPLPPPPPAPTQPVKPVGYQPTAEERQLLSPEQMRGGISHFANMDDKSTAGRNMGISGEPANSPKDQWYCAMRFAYCQTKVNPKNPFWVQTVNGTSNMALKGYLPGRKLKVTNPSTGKSVIVRPADWGPGAWAIPGGKIGDKPVYRVVDVSETAINAIGAQTDTEVVVEWVDPSTPLGPMV